MSYSLLLIDDDQDILTAWKMFLEDLEIDVHFAASGVEGRKILDKEGTNIDVIISDVAMPDGEGVSVINYVLKLEREPPLFIFVTGSSHIDSQFLVGIGANKVFHKPVDINVILEYIEVELEKKRSQK